MPSPVNISNVILDDVVSFSTYSGALSDIADGIVVGFSAGSTLRDPTNAATRHANIWPAIPEEDLIANDFTSYDYVLIRKTDNQLIEIGIPWIIPVTLTRSLRATATIIINDFDPNKKDAIRELLALNGFAPDSFVITES